ncbi:hypothetical protein CQA57_07035 [Helicobacter anseris]|uniref:Uncharacterized protein n=1 Tax=Helicobacter anseris TaxID=375926 RepID=A0A3D8J545_9HELI|nr:hypothetical protein [Helicobacter anseris]RDU72350.1 hypothetical protein CQA57_07035 [Helicobacter anseris]
MKNEIMEGQYRGFKYIVTRQNFETIPSYCCGYIVIDKDLMKELGITYSSGFDMYDRDMEVTFIYDSDKDEEWDLWFDLHLNENENVFGFDRGHICNNMNTQADMKSTELLCHEWIDYIVENKKELK